jgi:hypothetical protein
MDEKTLNLINQESDIIITELIAFFDDYTGGDLDIDHYTDKPVFRAELKKHLIKFVAKLQSNEDNG